MFWISNPCKTPVRILREDATNSCYHHDKVVQDMVASPVPRRPNSFPSRVCPFPADMSVSERDATQGREHLGASVQAACGCLQIHAMPGQPGLTDWSSPEHSGDWGSSGGGNTVRSRRLAHAYFIRRVHDLMSKLYLHPSIRRMSQS